MKKYLIVAENTFKAGFIYRFGTLMLFTGELLVFVFFYYLWSSIYSSGQQIGSYSLRGIISYYLILNFILLTTKNNNAAWQVGDEIRLGELNNNLLKPFSYFGYVLFNSIGRLLYFLSVYTLLFLCLFLLLKNYIDLPNNFSTLGIFVLLALLGFVINFLISYLIGLSAFWLGMIMGVNFAFSNIVSFFQGAFVPLDLLPDYLNRINDLLPFKYVVFTPIEIFTNRIVFSWDLIYIPIFWIIVLLILAKVIFKWGVKKYEGYGT